MGVVIRVKEPQVGKITIKFKQPAVVTSPPASPRRERLRKEHLTNWGELVRDIREEQGLSQRELSSLAGVNRNALRRLEKDESPGAIDVLERLVHILGYELDLYGIQKRFVKIAA
jgi:ribosome-binding protein aMBF1 (putative translation factor)